MRRIEAAGVVSALLVCAIAVIWLVATAVVVPAEEPASTTTLATSNEVEYGHDWCTGYASGLSIGWHYFSGYTPTFDEFNDVVDTCYEARDWVNISDFRLEPGANPE
jgi:hypothetical protein